MKKKKFKFSGHESFSCRTYWLKKGFDFVNNGGQQKDTDSVIKLGVGKNMVPAIFHWLKSFSIIDDDNKTNLLWDEIFKNEKGLDPFLENKGTLYLLHYYIVKTNYASAYSMFFNKFRREQPDFNKKQVSDFIISKLNQSNFKDYTVKTIDRDVNVMINNYYIDKQKSAEDEFNKLLIDLELVKKINNDQLFAFNTNEKEDFPWQIFLYIILDLFPETQSIELRNLKIEDNSPGLIFSMNDSGLIAKMEEISKKHKDVVYKNDAGIHTISFKFKRNIDKEKMELLNNYYAN